MKLGRASLKDAVERCTAGLTAGFTVHSLAVFALRVVLGWCLRVHLML